MKYGPNEFVLMDETQKIVHYTFIFQIFVFMQLFNIINARKIEGELNVFDGFFNNPLFIFIIILSFGIQLSMVEVGGQIVKTYALNQNQNLICMAFGCGTLIWGFLLKFMPLRLFQWVSLDETPMTEEEIKSSLSNQFKTSSSLRKGSSSNKYGSNH
jgi:Ca2+ transporting ATPase